MAIGVYQIEVNGKIYIGSSALSISRRWTNHLSELRRGVHGNNRLQRAFKKYGEDSFCFSIVEIVEKQEDCIPTEQKYIDKFHPELNLYPFARSALGTKRSEETKIKTGNASRGRKHSDETKKKISEATKARPLSRESREKVRIALIGHSVSNETREKLRLFHLGKPSPMKGKEHTAETKTKMSIAKKGKKNSNMSRKFSDETKLKMSEARKKYYQNKKRIFGMRQTI
jgi:hypothetical protein